MPTTTLFPWRAILRATVETCASDVWRANLSDMSFEEFRDSLQQDDPPGVLSPALAGLWWDGKGDWTKAT